MDDTMYRKHSILCSTDQYRSVNVYFIMIHWSVTIFPYNISSSISILHPYTKKKKIKLHLQDLTNMDIFTCVCHCYRFLSAKERCHMCSSRL